MKGKLSRVKYVFVLIKMSDIEKDQNAKAELKKRLTPMQYHVTQEKGTER